MDKYGPRVMRRFAHIALGLRICSGPGKHTYPSEAAQTKALATLANKILPDLAAQSLSGPDDKPLFPVGQVSNLEVARWMAAKLEMALPEAPEKSTPATSDKPAKSFMPDSVVKLLGDDPPPATQDDKPPGCKPGAQQPPEPERLPPDVEMDRRIPELALADIVLAPSDVRFRG